MIITFTVLVPLFTALTTVFATVPVNFYPLTFTYHVYFGPFSQREANQEVMYQHSNLVC